MNTASNVPLVAFQLAVSFRDSSRSAGAIGQVTCTTTEVVSSEQRSLAVAEACHWPSTNGATVAIPEPEPDEKFAESKRSTLADARTEG